MAPTSLMMIHNPMTMAFGDREDMKKAMDMLDEVKESIINAYEIRTGLSCAKLSHYMDSETWMNANKAIELGFADDVLRDEKRAVTDEAFAFSGKAAQTSLMNKLCRPVKNAVVKETMAQMAAIPAKDVTVNDTANVTVNDSEEAGTKVSNLEKRLSLLK